MRRRSFLAGLLFSAPAIAHTPYGQWIAYRRKHLLIGCHRGDPVTYDLATRLAERLGHLLPEARARVARAPGMDRIASLMGTGQMDIAILDSADAAAMAAGSGKFRAYGAIPLGLLAPLRDGKVLVARRAFRADHAWTVASAVDRSGLASQDDPAALPWHPGAERWRAGEEMPEITEN